MRSFTVPDHRTPPRFEGPLPRSPASSRAEVDRIRAEYRRIVARQPAPKPAPRPVAPPPDPEPADSTGVRFNRSARLWRAEIDGRSLGGFATRNLAIHARQVALGAIAVKRAEREAKKQRDTVHDDSRPRTPTPLSQADRAAILAYIDAMPGGVTASQVRTSGPTVHVRTSDKIPAIRAYLDELVEAGELVTWRVETAIGRSWWCYGRRMPSKVGEYESSQEPVGGGTN